MDGVKCVGAGGFLDVINCLMDAMNSGWMRIEQKIEVKKEKKYVFGSICCEFR